MRKYSIIGVRQEVGDEASDIHSRDGDEISHVAIHNYLEFLHQIEQQRSKDGMELSQWIEKDGALELSIGKFEPQLTVCPLTGAKSYTWDLNADDICQFLSLIPHGMIKRIALSENFWHRVSNVTNAEGVQRVVESYLNAIPLTQTYFDALPLSGELGFYDLKPVWEKLSSKNVQSLRVADGMLEGVLKSKLTSCRELTISCHDAACLKFYKKKLHQLSKALPKLTIISVIDPFDINKSRPATELNELLAKQRQKKGRAASFLGIFASEDNEQNNTSEKRKRSYSAPSATSSEV